MKTPQRFTGRAGSGVSGRVRRALDGAVDTSRRVDDTLAVGKDGRLGAKLARSGGLRMGPDGLELDPIAVGEKNHDPMPLIKELDSGASAATIAEAFNNLLRELRRTKRMRG